MKRAALIFLALAVLHTWPLASAPQRLSLNHNADAQLNAWIVSWIAHTLPTNPSHFWQGNIFQPGEQALTFSEPLVVPAVLGAPILWLGGTPVLMFNLLLLGGLAGTGLAGWWVVRRWTGSSNAGLVAGALLAFNPHLLTRLPHLQAAHAWGVILACYFADRALQRQGPWWPLAIIWPLLAATSLHWLLFAAGAVGLLVLITGRSLAGVTRVGTATVVGAVCSLPMLWPHLTSGVTRPLSQVADFSATPAGYLTSMSRLHGGWTSAFFTTDLNVFFPGFIALALAAVGVAAAWRIDASVVLRARARWLLLLAVAGVVLSLGTATPIYGWLYDLLPPLRGIRAAARFGFWYLLAVAVLAGTAVAWLERRVTRQVVPWMVTLLVLGVTVENLSAPIRVTPYSGTPALYSLIAHDTRRTEDQAAHPTDVLLAEFPFYPPDAVFENGEYVLNAASHWWPLVNGYSGVTPLSYRERAGTLWFFPDEGAVATMVRLGVTHAMVHLERFGTDAPAVIRALERIPNLRLLGADREGHRLYRVVPARASTVGGNKSAPAEVSSGEVVEGGRGPTHEPLGR